jgi:predicted signal transduction protein with EAL and GGDEF domain
VSGRRRTRLRVAAAVLATVAAAGAVAVVWALPGMVRFLAGAPAGFWIMVGLALTVDAPLYLFGPRSPVRVRSTLSVCIALAIFVLWGAAPAIVVQAAAAAVCATGQRFGPGNVVVFVSRHVLALVAAGAVTLAIFPRQEIVHPIVGLAGKDLVPFAVMAVVWFATSLALMQVAAAVVSGHGPRRVVLAVREHLLVATASILLVEPLLTTITGWWSVLIALPLYTWNLLAGAQIRRERHVERDPVTGTLNRHGLDERIEMLTLYDYMRADAMTPFAVAVLISDKPLTVNRVLGREMYEKLLTKAGRQLLGAFGDGQVGVLAGGEGFILILPGLTGADAESAIKSAILRLTAAPIEVNGIPFRLVPTAGVALSPEHGRDLATLVTKAELASEEARRSGRLAGVYVESATAETSRRTAVLSEVRAALADPARADEITLVYQPQVELRTGRLAGVEALVRWTHPDWGTVTPEALLEAVEPSDVMHLLTAHILNRTAAQLRAWNDQGFRMRAAVNASVHDFHESSFVEEIDAAIRTYGIHPAQLTIEITERIAVSGDVLVARTADAVAGLGVGLSIDDFGTGFASMQQLRTLPLTEVKIDKSYVSSMLTNPEDWAIVRGVHQLARALKLDVVAEGVENRRMAAALTRLPGTIGQGWHFGRPMTAEALEDWHRSRQQ